MFSNNPLEFTMKGAGRLLAVASVAASLAGCISPNAGTDGRYATPIGDAPVINNETPYSNALRCVAQSVPSGAAAPRIAVGNIQDYTGKAEPEGGRKVTQGAALMAISALAKSGVSLVERYDTGVTELELKYANNKLIGDEDGGAFRQIVAGSIRGSDYYLVGGITELNFNIRSGGADGFYSDLDADGAKANLMFNQFVMNVGLDLRLVDSRTLEVVDVVSYQKQIIGREIKAGIFNFFGTHLFDLAAGEKAMEPLQLAVRSVIERAVLEMIVPVYGVDPTNCAEFGKNGDPLGEIHYDNPRKNTNGHMRTASAPVRPYDYYSEPVFTGLRGRVN
ncbi:holdfast anchoring protein HfaB [Tepidicaulis sp. LMO-SS28]|uniref:holdfast anchoring protein HfaB n=1 Tax=Tepidicaulis sp. LMO-SS28 TaxID=3447455 RepID=UPI003EE10BA1